MFVRKIRTFNVDEIDPWGQFRKHFCPTFLHKQDGKFFFDEQRLANGAQIWQIFKRF